MTRLPTFEPRVVTCSFCNGSGRMASRYSDAGLECPECSGEGSWPAECCECHQPKPLNRFGMCEECDVASLGVEMRRVA